MAKEMNDLHTNTIRNYDEFEAIFRETAGRLAPEGYVMAQCTDLFHLQKIGDAERTADELELHRLYQYGLDIRIFGEKGEGRFFRGSIGRYGQDDDTQLFRFRSIFDKEKDENQTERSPHTGHGTEDHYSDYFDEEQFLDIDTKRSNEKEGIAQAIGGGTYRLPLNHYSDAKIRLRNYLKYDEKTGMASVCDWRCVGFKEGIPENTGKAEGKGE